MLRQGSGRVGAVVLLHQREHHIDTGRHPADREGDDTVNQPLAKQGNTPESIGTLPT